ncbi:MAG: hypothetical protein H6739_16610 [Alphaproteobacteria bacterium]|nr:hypothetical protein [Alphaproteobacteria bacterium]
MTNKAPGDEQLKVFGALLAGYAQACVNLNIVTGGRGIELTQGIEVNQWYPYSRLKELEELVIQSYADNAPILERVGIEMMQAWFHFGPGREIVDHGLGFLDYQTGSAGYASVVSGPPEYVGAFSLLEVNKDAGRARIHSTTPLNRDMERGVIIGGMSAPGDLDFVDVSYDPKTQIHIVEFH